MWWWSSQRVRDVAAFDAELNQPLYGELAGHVVTDRELEEDAQSFMAFAKAVGVPVPRAATG